jgi:hypothetical protein
MALYDHRGEGQGSGGERMNPKVIHYYNIFRKVLLVLTVPLFWYMMQFAVLGLATYDAENPCLDESGCMMTKAVFWSIHNIIPFVGIAWLIPTMKEMIQWLDKLGRKKMEAKP